MGYQIEELNTTRPLYFLLVQSSDHITGATGKTPTVTLLKSGGIFAAATGAITEISNGLYAVAPVAADADTLGPLLLHATAAGCDPRDDNFEVVSDLATIAAALSPASTTTAAVPASRIIDGALRLIGVLQGGETAAADDANDALIRLNELVDATGTQRLWASSEARSPYNLTTAASYTIGPGGTFNQTWPEIIPRAGLVYTSGSVVFEWPLTRLTPTAYSRIASKAITSPFPTGYYYDHAYANGLGSITLWPVPDGTTSLQIALYYPSNISQFATLATTYALPPAYAKMLRYNLAVDLWPEYPEQPLNPMVLRTAQQTLADIKRSNIALVDAHLDSAGMFGGSTSTGRYNIFVDG